MNKPSCPFSTKIQILLFVPQNQSNGIKKKKKKKKKSVVVNEQQIYSFRVNLD